MGYSRNALGEFGDDGVQRNAAGDVVEPGLDADAKAEFKRLSETPKVRRVPSERDAFLAAGGTLKEFDYDPKVDSVPSGGWEDIAKQEKSAKGNK